MSQLSFATLDYAAKKKRTKRNVFLAEMAEVVPGPGCRRRLRRIIPRPGRTAVGTPTPSA